MCYSLDAARLPTMISLLAVALLSSPCSSCSYCRWCRIMFLGFMQTPLIITALLFSPVLTFLRVCLLACALCRKAQAKHASAEAQVAAARAKVLDCWRLELVEAFKALDVRGRGVLSESDFRFLVRASLAGRARFGAVRSACLLRRRAFPRLPGHVLNTCRHCNLWHSTLPLRL